MGNKASNEGKAVKSRSATRLALSKSTSLSLTPTQKAMLKNQAPPRLESMHVTVGCEDMEHASVVAQNIGKQLQSGEKLRGLQVKFSESSLSNTLPNKDAPNLLPSMSPAHRISSQSLIPVDMMEEAMRFTEEELAFEESLVTPAVPGLLTKKKSWEVDKTKLVRQRSPERSGTKDARKTSMMVGGESRRSLKLRLPPKYITYPQNIQTNSTNSLTQIDEGNEIEADFAELENLLQKVRDQRKTLLPSAVGYSSEGQTYRAQLGRWRKGPFLGHGALGTVFIARDERNGLLMTVRVIKVQEGTECSAANLREIQLFVQDLSKLQHTNIVSYFGSELYEGFLFIYEEYIPGGTLNSVLESFPGCQHHEIIRIYAKQILAGLEYLHENGVAHHDINAFNILVGENGTLKLRDFGLFQYIKRFDVEGKAQILKKERWKVTTNPLLMPVNLRMQIGTGLKADVWGVGCTIIHLLTGQPPWEVVEYEQDCVTEMKILNGNDPPQIPRGTDQLLKDFLALCFQRDPEARPGASELMQHAFLSSRDGKDDFFQTIPPRPPVGVLSYSTPPESPSNQAPGSKEDGGPESTRSNAKPALPSWDEVPVIVGGVGGAPDDDSLNYSSGYYRAGGNRTTKLQRESAAFQREQLQANRILNDKRWTSTPPRTDTTKVGRPTYPEMRPRSKETKEQAKKGSDGASANKGTHTSNKKSPGTKTASSIYKDV